MESMAGERIGRAVTSDDKDENGGEIVEPAEDDRGSHVCAFRVDSALIECFVNAFNICFLYPALKLGLGV